MGLVAIEVSILTGSGSFQGSKANLTHYSSSEEATPLAAGDSRGGVGTVEFGATEEPETKWLNGSDIELIDTGNGVVRGRIRNLSSSNLQARISADSLLALTNVERQSGPFVGTLEDGFRNMASLAGLEGSVQVQASLASRAVVWPGWSGNLWHNLKLMCQAEQVEISAVYGRIVLREARSNTSTLMRQSDSSWNISTRAAARAVEVNYYNTEYRSSGMFYPVASSQSEPSVYTVSAGETLDPILITVDGWIETLDQPVALSSIGPDYAGTSAYVVTGNDGLVIPPAQWADWGGSVTVSIGEDSSQLSIQVQGPTAPDAQQYSPYRLAMSSGANIHYPALYISGSGLFTDVETLTLYTGASGDNTQEEIGITVESPWIRTREQAYRAGMLTVAQFTSSSFSVQGSAVRMNREGSGSEFANPPISAFNEAAGVATIADFNAEWAGQTFADFNDFWRSTVIDQYDNQQFGNVAGSRIRREDAWHRVLTAQVGPGGTSFTAEIDTLISDFNAQFAGESISDFNQRWTGKLFREFDVRPLMEA